MRTLFDIHIERQAIIKQFEGKKLVFGDKEQTQWLTRLYKIHDEEEEVTERERKIKSGELNLKQFLVKRTVEVKQEVIVQAESEEMALQVSNDMDNDEWDNEEYDATLSNPYAKQIGI